MTEEQIQQIESRFKQYADKHLNPYSIIASDNWSLIHEIRTLKQQNKQLIEAISTAKEKLERQFPGYTITAWETLENVIQQIKVKDDQR